MRRLIPPRTLAPVGSFRVLAIAVLALAYLAGHLASSELAVPSLVALTAATAAWAARSHLAVVLPAVAVVAALNGVPGIDLSRVAVPGTFKATDVCAALLLLLSLRGYLVNQGAPTAFQGFLVCWAATFGAYWAMTFLATVDSGISPRLAFSSGRDLLLFALLAPMARHLFSSRAQALAFAAAVASLTALYSLCAILAALNVVPASLPNADHTTSIGSLTRVYTYMNQLIALVFLLAICYAVSQSGRRARAASVVAGITGVCTLLLLTRAIYFGIAVGLLAVALIWLTTEDPRLSKARRRVVLGISTLAATAAVVFLVPAISSSSTVATLQERLSGSVADIADPGASRANTVEYRRNLTANMLQYLDNEWPVGLGFQHPTQKYFVDLPAGSLRNPDVGIFNQLMTVGAIGALLFFIPILGLAVVCFRRARRSDTRNAWFWMGATAWCAYVVGTVLTLGVSNTGAVIVAASMLGLASCYLSEDGVSRVCDQQTGYAQAS